MGNRNNREVWASRERLGLIERTAWWRGVVNRSDLRDVFGISDAQASADLQGYLALNPGALHYNLRSKRYEAAPGMECRLFRPRLEDAVRMFLGGETFVPAEVDCGVEKVAMCVPPQRKAKEKVERRVFVALEGKRKMRIRYGSMNSGAKWREIAPHALGHDGLRWHARAWCFENEEYRDFVLSRIEDAEWPEDGYRPPVPDVAWDKMIALEFRPHEGLTEEQRQTIERDYGMKNGCLKVVVREAMKPYCLAQLRVGEGFIRHLELVE